MKVFKRVILPILISIIWISISEFVRNEFIIKSYWINHYHSLGIIFPSKPINGAIWGIWSLIFACVIYVLAKKFTLFETTLLSWVIGFAMTWLVIGNMGVLPERILLIAVPLSLLESFLAVYIVYKLKKFKSH
jgi:Na+-transporting NADH:ubiquinone oxidoreductase subunit NqrE